MSSIGERIAYARELCDMKQKDLAETVGITNATMSKYENNINIPNADILAKLASALNTSTDYLVGRTNNVFPYHISAGDYSTENLFNLILKLNNKNKIRIFERALTLLEEQENK